MNKHLPFSKTEMKLLIHKKMESGKSYRMACDELSDEIDKIIENDLKKKKEEKKNATKNKNQIFKEAFVKLTNGK